VKSVLAAALRRRRVTLARSAENGENDRIVRAGRSQRESRTTTAPESPEVSSAARAALLVEAIRRTRMTRGRVGEPKRLLCDHIASTMSDRGVPARLASRLAFQLVLKCEPAHLGSLATWQAMGDQVHTEVEHLRDLGLVDRGGGTITRCHTAPTPALQHRVLGALSERLQAGHQPSSPQGQHRQTPRMSCAVGTGPTIGKLPSASVISGGATPRTRPCKRAIYLEG
jgi:hypothetical protein